jgi:hypothetical protein
MSKQTTVGGDCRYFIRGATGVGIRRLSVIYGPLSSARFKMLWAQKERDK